MPGSNYVHPRKWIKREIIGAPECPILYRWTLLDARKFKIMVHRFLPDRQDRDPHDHPRPFLTLVLRGGYVDLVPCEHCHSTGLRTFREEVWCPIEKAWIRDTASYNCTLCGGYGLRVGDVLRAGSVRFRSPNYAHNTKTDYRGAWTIVIMGPIARLWGFWRGSVWWHWKEYEQEFGKSMRCE